MHYNAQKQSGLHDAITYTQRKYVGCNFVDITGATAVCTGEQNWRSTSFRPLLLFDEFRVDPVTFGGVCGSETNLTPVAICFEDVDILGFANRHNDVSGTARLVANVDCGVGGDNECKLRR